MPKLNLKTGIQTLSPTYFALPMSTGVISIASYTLGYSGISNLLFVFNNIEFAILLILFILRLLFFFKDFKKDLGSHQEGAGFLTIVASACILGTEYALLRHLFTPAVILLFAATAVWMILTYSFFILVTIKKVKPTLENGINGSWLLFVVSVQALSILGDITAPHLHLSLQNSSFVALFFYLLGVLFYIIVIGIIFYRTTFFPMKANEFKPSYWIDMGAAAITTLAGTLIVKNMSGIPVYSDFIPTIKVLCVLFWIAGTWWIPVIVFLEIWRHKSIPIQYNAGYWSLVFPLGVYTLATWHLATTLNLSFLKHVPDVFIYIAWAAWIIILVGMGFKLINSFFINKSTPELKP